MAAHKSSAMACRRKASSRAGPKVSKLRGIYGSSAGGNGKSIPVRM